MSDAIITAVATILGGVAGGALSARGTVKAAYITRTGEPEPRRPEQRHWSSAAILLGALLGGGFMAVVGFARSKDPPQQATKMVEPEISSSTNPVQPPTQAAQQGTENNSQITNGRTKTARVEQPPADPRKERMQTATQLSLTKKPSQSPPAHTSGGNNADDADNAKARAAALATAYQHLDGADGILKDDSNSTEGANEFLLALPEAVKSRDINVACVVIDALHRYTSTSKCRWIDNAFIAKLRPYLSELRPRCARITVTDAELDKCARMQ